MKYLVLGPGGMGGYAMIGHLMKHKKLLNNASIKMLDYDFYSVLAKPNHFFKRMSK